MTWIFCSQVIESGDSADALQIGISFVSLLPTLFLFCYIGDRVTQRFENIGDAVYQLEWYTLPLDMQRSLAIVIALAQRRIYVRGFANVRSTREMFKKVSGQFTNKSDQWQIHSMCSYYNRIQFGFAFSDADK